MLSEETSQTSSIEVHSGTEKGRRPNSSCATQPPQATNKVERLNLLRCYVQRHCEDAGQLGMPQAREEFAEVKLKHAQMLCAQRLCVEHQS